LSSSASSASSSGAPPTSADDEGRPADDEGRHADIMMEPQESSQGGAAGSNDVPCSNSRQTRSGRNTVLLPTTTFWHGCRFTEVKGGGDEHVGWEVTCRCDDHHDGASMCRKTLKFKRTKNPVVVERKLKWWLVSAGAAATKDEHINVKFPKDVELPSMADLEKQAQQVFD
jgi:hypothetical protein